MRRVALGEVARFVRGVTFKPDDVTNTPGPGFVGVMRTKNVQQDLDLRDVVHIPRELVRREEQLLQLGDILISSANSWSLVGKCCWIPKLEFPCAIGGFVTGLRATSPHIDPRYLYRWLSSPQTQAALRSTANQTTNIANLSLRRCEELPLPLPPVTEQRRIAAILDHAYALRAKRHESIVQYTSLADAIFMHMFGDPDTAAAVGPAIRMRDVAELQGGRNLVADDGASQSDFRVLKISAVTSGEFRPSESKPLPDGYTPPLAHIVRQGDLLISRANTTELVGAVAYVDHTVQNLALPDKIWRFVWHDPGSVPLYFRSLFQNRSVRRRISQLASGTGGSMKNISKAKLMELELPRTPTSEQREFEARVRAIPRPSLTQFDELFASLQTRAFSGQL